MASAPADPASTYDFDPADPVFVAHEGGKLGVVARTPLRDSSDLSVIYTPGVAQVCRAIAADATLSMRYTSRSNTVAVVSDGTAVLGLGNIGPEAAMPVMEGKAVLFKHFADVDAVPVCMNSGTVEELVDAIARIAPTYGGINLEDISAPRCFEIERKLQERLNIPVFHDDQHGTAVVAYAALINAAKVTGQELKKLRVVVGGAGAAGVAITDILRRSGIPDVVVCDTRGVVEPYRTDLKDHKPRLAMSTNPRGVRGTLGDALRDANVYIGVSGGTVPEEFIATMAPGPIIFALANPDPEVHPDIAHKYASVVATGRSDFPNQINNVLAFPGIFRGALDSGAPAITEWMKIAAAQAIAGLVENPTADKIVPSPFDERVAPAVAAAVAAHA
ncbi:malate dehydrogenase (oxaloacetate-decarboxylating) [Branchiibius hedensis]|uniref:Malate dehydrogenase (Oxaloacetate-decarboxylating) n=1 Tax=Branchiibius hedensis TaxID=672460 RepID=A0A2Y9C139_9MICO|nr:NADP-dependent malic enzyme [Branchiibius hedensis]PWJ24807.1 malate dehydrogenase (oxaloacetate-decarboxylating) [Branchiibius hedensis]SSA33623.1 malate dehydrogenase (oxaloacetate-decarboxylating) [Branchiibius hedensis]